jgi:hypothetical protein
VKDFTEGLELRVEHERYREEIIHPPWIFN